MKFSAHRQGIGREECSGNSSSVCGIRLGVGAEKKGPIYSAHVKLDRATMQVGERTVNLLPGMAVTVEIKTDRRRVIEYFLAPLMQYRDESLRKR